MTSNDNDCENNYVSEEVAYRTFISKDVEPIFCHEEKSDNDGDYLDDDDDDNKPVALSFLFKCRDLDENSYRTIRQQNVILPSAEKENVPPSTISLSTITLPKNIIAIVPSPSGHFQAHFIVNENKDDKQKKSQYGLEIWNDSSLVHRMDLPTKPFGVTHTNIESTWFGGSCWSTTSTDHEEEEEEYLVYGAEPTISSSPSSFYSDHKDETQSSASLVVGQDCVADVGIPLEWGEGYVDVHPMITLFVVQISSGRILPLNPTFPDKSSEFTLGQPLFSHSGKHVIYTAWDATSSERKLGAIYCTQRNCQLYQSTNPFFLSSSNINNDYANTTICITPSDKLARSPTLLPEKSCDKHINSHDNNEMIEKIAYLANEGGFTTHNGCMGINILRLPNHIVNTDTESKQQEQQQQLLYDKKTMLPVISLPNIKMNDDTSNGSSISNLSFPGLFAMNLSRHTNGCLYTSLDGQYFYTNTQWGTVSAVIRISITDGTIERVLATTNDDDSGNFCHYSHELLHVTSKGSLILKRSSPNQPSQIIIQKRNNNQWFVLKNSPRAICSSKYPKSKPFLQQQTNDFKSLSFEIIHTMNPPYQDLTPNLPLQSILLLPPSKVIDTNDEYKEEQNQKSIEKKKLPLIVFLHGGPHSCSSTRYVSSLSYLCEHGGYAILSVNYRGSSGFGQDFVEALAGRIGTLDVSDVVHVTEQVLEQHSHILDSNRVGICGGSHGGYLTCHLIGRYSHIFKVASMRNPVANVASMVTATDIPDWCYVESLGIDHYDEFLTPPTPEQLQKMYSVSPIQYVSQVTSPTLIALGLSDKRVPSSQGMEYYHSLSKLTHNQTKKLLLYPKDAHPISIVRSEASHWINTKLWFDEHL